jgi:aldose 1-epimerase
MRRAPGFCKDEELMKIGLLKGILLTMMTTLGAQGAVNKAPFGKTPGGKAIEIYTLKSAQVEVRIMTYGARVVSIKTADKAGKVDDIVLGGATVGDYFKGKDAHFGSIVGRYGNRINAGKFSIDGQTYQAPKNENGKEMLHGGTVGFDAQVWTGREVPEGVEMTLVSKDGDMGFPGTLTAHVTYTLKGSALHINYRSSTDKPTVVNLTNHSYFNLAGEGSGTILDETLTLNADAFTPVNADLIPTGEIKPVAGTPFDFRQPTVIGSRIDADNEQLKVAGGYDHNWVLNGSDGVMKLAAKVSDPKSGRTLTVTTTEPGVQFYTGNFLDSTHIGPSGTPYAKRGALCLETQHFPDSPNQPKFPSTLLKPGETRRSETVFTFGVEK